jgi:hypothetical protein
MKITVNQLGLINTILQVDKEGKTRQFPLAELTTASDIFKEIKKLTEPKEIDVPQKDGSVKKETHEFFKEGELELTSEQKVFITKLIDERDFTVYDAEVVFELKKLIK